MEYLNQSHNAWPNTLIDEFWNDGALDIAYANLEGPVAPGVARGGRLRGGAAVCVAD